MPTVRVLVVDDHALMRRTIYAYLSADPTLDVICQTASGEEAVSKAEELQPDLILLDISLPGISGIEAARQIRKGSAKSRIIFLSQHDSIHMVNEAMKTGGHGYVTKFDAAVELLEAVRSVCNGTRFVSRRIRDQGWTSEAPTFRAQVEIAQVRQMSLEIERRIAELCDLAAEEHDYGKLRTLIEQLLECIAARDRQRQDAKAELEKQSARARG